MKISLILAMDERMTIGHEGDLPWHLPGELARFRALTMGKPIVMGRKTAEAIGRALPGRLNVVVTRRSGFALPNFVVAHSPDDALARCEGAEEVMVIGGASLLEDFLPRADRMYLTVVHGVFEGDTFFPSFDEGQWRVVRRERVEADAKNAHAFTLFVLERTAEGMLHVEHNSGPRALPGLLADA